MLLEMHLPSSFVNVLAVWHLASVLLTFISPVNAANCSAVSVPVQTEWVGNDGSWST